jgi:hypothetical protein
MSIQSTGKDVSNENEPKNKKPRINVDDDDLEDLSRNKNDDDE